MATFFKKSAAVFSPSLGGFVKSDFFEFYIWKLAIKPIENRDGDVFYRRIYFRKILDVTVEMLVIKPVDHKPLDGAFKFHQPHDVLLTTELFTRCRIQFDRI